jgi:hypothetical protein
MMAVMVKEVDVNRIGVPDVYEVLDATACASSMARA